MTVADIIEQLRQMPQDMEVITWNRRLGAYDEPTVELEPGAVVIGS